MLKDDQDMTKLGLKPNQMLMVIGAAGPLPEAPKQQVVFMEDMTDTELAEAVAFPVGLANLGNTCYMNSTLQAFRSIPELQTSLNAFSNSNPASQSDAVLTTQLRDLYQQMGKTSEGFPPMMFLAMLRQWAPQFAERSRQTGGYSQQDAQEAWSSILQAAKPNLKLEGKGFVQNYLEGEIEKTLRTAEAPDEPATSTKEKFLDIKCNISSTTNYMINGITEAMDQEIEKNSPSLGRSAVYKEQTKITRLPSYLTVNLVRFYWRREIGKKTKIMRKVKFPFDLDMYDLLSDDLKKKVQGVNEKLKEVDKDRRERTKVRRRAKVQADPAAAGSSSDAMAVDGAADPPEVEAQDPVTTSGELVDEPSKRMEEVAMLKSLVHPELEADVGANVSGLYELQAVVTHKGASADGGHYIAFSRVTKVTKEGEIELEDRDKEQWYKFDDEKVSVVGRDKITALEGGGEDHCAYILLYASKKLE
ncbi:ubiquitin carboxyl-terminal hydrolase 14 [Pseudohyphozyma bogoriensis]|nr:ubiquitin carboxyl-terminal hydrolase 14 [Pseudohyphozyma bogoriensis]